MSAGVTAKNAGGGLCARGGVFAGHYGICILSVTRCLDYLLTETGGAYSNAEQGEVHHPQRLREVGEGVKELMSSDLESHHDQDAK